jgi:hypothetical protein
LDISEDLLGVSLQQVEAWVQPSGAGELTINALNVAGDLVEFSLSGGQAGRSYLVKVDVTPFGTLPIEYQCWIYIDRVFAIWPILDPPVAGFGSSTTWTYVPSIDFGKPQNSWMTMIWG